VYRLERVVIVAVTRRGSSASLPTLIRPTKRALFPTVRIQDSSSVARSEIVGRAYGGSKKVPRREALT